MGAKDMMRQTGKQVAVAKPQGASKYGGDTGNGAANKSHKGKQRGDFLNAIRDIDQAEGENIGNIKPGSGF